MLKFLRRTSNPTLVVTELNTAARTTRLGCFELIPRMRKSFYHAVIVICNLLLIFFPTCSVQIFWHQRRAPWRESCCVTVPSTTASRLCFNYRHPWKRVENFHLRALPTNTKTNTNRGRPLKLPLLRFLWFQFGCRQTNTERNFLWKVCSTFDVTSDASRRLCSVLCSKIKIMSFPIKTALFVKYLLEKSSETMMTKKK